MDPLCRRYSTILKKDQRSRRPPKHHQQNMQTLWTNGLFDQKRDSNIINRRDRSFHARQQTFNQRTCIYCEGDHKPVECQKVNDVNERRKI